MVQSKAVEPEPAETIENPVTLKRIQFSFANPQPPPPVTYVLLGLAERTVGGLVGPDGLGKSMLLLQTCMSIGAGEDLAHIWGERPIKGRTVYLGFEDPEAVVQERLFKLSDMLVVRTEVREAIEQNCKFHSLFGDKSSPAIAKKEKIWTSY